MTRPLCPVHQTPLVFDERRQEYVSEPFGSGERTYVVERFVCPQRDCTEFEEDAA